MAFGYWKTGQALKGLGKYRVRRAQQVANRRNDGLGGHHYLALGLRETLLQNIESFRKDESGKPEDTGWIQISRRWNAPTLKTMPAVRAGTWAPVIGGRSPLMAGYCPRYEEALTFTHSRFGMVMGVARENGVRAEDLPRFVIASHNAGLNGAMRGYRAGDVDRYTTGGDYSAWVLEHARYVKRWLALHPRWKV